MSERVRVTSGFPCTRAKNNSGARKIRVVSLEVSNGYNKTDPLNFLSYGSEENTGAFKGKESSRAPVWEAVTMVVIMILMRTSFPARGVRVWGASLPCHAKGKQVFPHTHTQNSCVCEHYKMVWVERFEAPNFFVCE